jgi:hypothetical protein
VATTSFFYGKAFEAAFNAEIDFVDGPIKAILVSSSYTPSQDTHKYMSSVTGELADVSYARVALAGKSLTYDATLNKLKLVASSFTFPTLTGTFRHLLYIVDTGTAATSVLLKCQTWDTNQVASGQDVNVTVGADGIANIVVA